MNRRFVIPYSAGVEILVIEVLAPSLFEAFEKAELAISGHSDSVLWWWGVEID
jgi:hypothetical protein